MKFLTVLAASLVCSVCASASVLQVGPITLTGSGSFYDPDPGEIGEGFPGTLGLALNASGSNSVDSVSIHVYNINMCCSYYPPVSGIPSLGSTIVFSAGVSSCLIGFSIVGIVECPATIDGITGVGAFTGLGGGMGTVQVYAALNCASQFGCQAGALLAQADVVTYSDVITSVSTAPLNSPDNPKFVSTFILQPAPEPSTLALGLLGLAVLAGLRLRN